MPDDDFEPVDLINSSGLRMTAWTQKAFDEAMATGGYKIAPDLEIKKDGIEKTIAPRETPNLHGGRKESEV